MEPKKMKRLKTQLRFAKKCDMRELYRDDMIYSKQRRWNLSARILSEGLITSSLLLDSGGDLQVRRVFMRLDDKRGFFLMRLRPWVLRAYSYDELSPYGICGGKMTRTWMRRG
jgi:hypothetical protein